MENLEAFGIFLGGLGLFFLGIAALWGVDDEGELHVIRPSSRPGRRVGPVGLVPGST